MNKRLLGIISIVMILSANAMAIDFMGPPSASLDTGQWKIGYTYHQSKNDLLIKDITRNGTDTGIGDLDLDGLKLVRNYFTFNYGLESRRWEVYGFLGGANMDIDDTSFDAGNEFAIGVGTKITTNLSKDVDWGILVQTSWVNAEDKAVSGVFDSYSISGDAEFDMWELQVALGPTIKNEGWKVYGGPFFHVIGGDTEFTGLLEGFPGVANISGDLEQDNLFGGYIGIQIDLWKNVDIGVEYAYTGDADGFGGNVSLRF
jgi:opacity protein-like surface antigen